MSDTPETTKAWHECLNWCHARDEYHDPHHAALANLAERLERQRDAYAETLRDIIWTEPDWSAVEQRHPELSENHPAVAPATRDPASLDDVVAG